jgi:hypothetical protein
MKANKLTYIILELNSALDSGTYDDIPMREARQHIDAGDVVPWLKDRVKETDLSLSTDSDIAEYHASLSDIHGGYAGKERRKWGVERRALCLLLAWTNEILQQKCAAAEI